MPSIAHALNTPLAQVFPETAVPLGRLRRRRAQPDSAKSPEEALAEALSEPKTRDDLEMAGFDMDPELWSIKCRLRGGAECVFLCRAPRSADCGVSFKGGHDGRFVVFDADAHAVILNLDHLLLVNFLFETPNIVRDESDSEPDSGVSVPFAGETEFHILDIDSDEPEPEDEAEEDPGQFRNLLLEAELSTEPMRCAAFHQRRCRNGLFSAQPTCLTKSYLHERDDLIVFADPRASSRIDFTVYKTPQVTSSARKSAAKLRRLGQFWIMDSWKRDLRAEFDARLLRLSTNTPASFRAN